MWRRVTVIKMVLLGSWQCPSETCMKISPHTPLMQDDNTANVSDQDLQREKRAKINP